MSELERELRTLEMAWPATPDLEAAVRPRLEIPAPPRHAPRRRRLALFLAGLLLGGTAALEPARSAVLELLGLRGVRIERREPEAPGRPPGTGLQLGRPVALAQAQRAAGFTARPPEDPGRPDGVFVADGPGGARISFTYRPRPGLPESARTGVGILVTLLRPSVRPVLEKTAGAGTEVIGFEVGGSRAVFISGAPHGVAYSSADGGFFEAQRLAGTTLLVERDDLLIRVEGDLDRARAVAIARSIPR